MDPVLAFIIRCDAAAARMGLRRTTLSTKLFQDGKRLDGLATGSSDVGVRRLKLADEMLSRMERERSMRGKADRVA